MGRLVKNQRDLVDDKELEAAARSRMKAEERAKKEAEEQAKRVAEELQAAKQKPSWGSGGVHSLLDEYADEQASSPVVARRAEGEDDSATAYPVSQSKPKPTTAPVKLVSAWAPTGMMETSSNPKDVVQRALEGLQLHPQPQPMAAPAGAVDHALKLLGEALTFERERSVAAEGRAQRLEEQLAAVTQQLLDAQAKTIAQLQAQ